MNNFKDTYKTVLLSWTGLCAIFEILTFILIPEYDTYVILFILFCYLFGGYIVRASHNSFLWRQKLAYATLLAGLRNRTDVHKFLKINDIKLFETGFKIGKETVETTGKPPAETAILTSRWNLSVLWKQIKHRL